MSIALTIILSAAALILLIPKPVRWTIKHVGPLLLLAFCVISLFLFFRFSGRTTVVVTATGERNEQAEGGEIWLKSVLVDGKEYQAQELFSKGWISEEGYLKWRGYERPDYLQDTITGKIPSGKTIKLVFETSKWRGIAAVETETERYLFDTYSPGDKPRAKTTALEIPGKATEFVVSGKSLIFGLLGGLTFLAMVFTAIELLRKRKRETEPDIPTEPAAATQREVWLDVIKNISAFFIVVIHAVGGGYSGTYGTPQWTGFLILNTLPRFAVPVFIMASGAQLLGKEIPLGKALKKAGRAVILLFLWNLLYLLSAWLLRGVSPKETEFLAIPVVRQFSGHLWYFYFLVWLYLFSPIIGVLYRSLTVKQRWYFVLITLMIPVVLDFYRRGLDLGGTDLAPSFFLYMTFPYAGMMVLGRLVYEGYPHVQHKGLLSSALAIVGFVGMLVFTVLFSRAHGKPTDAFISETRLFPVLFGAGVFALASCTRESMEQVPDPLRQVTGFLSKRLLGVYSLHCLILWAMGKFTVFGITFSGSETALKAIPYTAVCYCLTVYCVAMTSKIPLLRKLVT